MRTHKSLKSRGLPWPRWALWGRLCRPNSSSWLRLSGSSMWGSSSTPRPGMSSGSSSSISEPVGQLVGLAVLMSELSSLDPAEGSSGFGLLLEQTETEKSSWMESTNTLLVILMLFIILTEHNQRSPWNILHKQQMGNSKPFVCVSVAFLRFSTCCQWMLFFLWFLTTQLLSTAKPWLHSRTWTPPGKTCPVSTVLHVWNI